MTCPKCKTSNPQVSKFCGTCGSQIKRKRSPILVGCLGFFGVIVVLGMLGSFINKGALPPSPRSSLPASVTAHERSTDPAVCLELLSKEGSVDEYSTTITGSIKNNCGRKFRYVQITFKLFDASGSVVGTALANQNDLDLDETWKFKAHGFAVCKTFRMTEITAF